jgi:hypothetical protein
MTKSQVRMPKTIHLNQLKKEHLVELIDKIESFRFLGIPATIGGRLTLRHDGSSWFDALPVGPIKLLHSAISKLSYGNVATQDWIEFYAAILSCYSVWLTARKPENETWSVLNPTPLYEELEYARHNKISSRKDLAERARRTIERLEIVQLKDVDIDKHTTVMGQSSQWRRRRRIVTRARKG